MKKRFLFTLIAALVAMSACFAQPVLRGVQPMSGVVRVKVQPSMATTLQRAAGLQPMSASQPLQVGINPFDASLRKIGGKSVRPVFPCHPSRAAEHAKYGLDQWFEVTFSPEISPMEARSVMASTPGVQTANVRVPMTLFEDGNYVQAAPATRAATGMPFDDPRLSSQWHYYNDGSLAGSVAGADVNLFEAWKIETGSSKVVVAIIDGGIDVQHEDLADHMWVNKAELNGRDGVDDDGNGYVDDVYGFNFCTSSGTIYPHNHGTHVAGTVGAINNNGIGVCGVAGGDGSADSGVRLISCQTFDSRSGVGDGDFAAAIVYAADAGATIAQCSWGWGTEGYYEQDVLDAISYFTRSARSNNMTGGLCIFASGNDGMTGDRYPACLDEVLAVASMTCELTPASYSNYGAWVDVTAPGGLMDFNAQQGVLSTLPSNSYGYNEGTSMATPHVSGIAALVLSKYGSPNLSNESLRQQIVTSVNDFYTLNPKAVGLFGSGYVDAYKALQWGDGTAPSAVSDLTAVAMQESINLQWTIPASSSNNVNSHILYYSTSPFTASTLDGCKTLVIDTKFNLSGERYEYELEGLEPLTKYYIALKAVDRWGNASPLSKVLTISTNAGPKMVLSRTSMAINCTDGVTWSARSFDISNADEGLLRWSIKTRTASSAIKAFGQQESKKLMTVPYSGHATIQPWDTSTSTGIVKDIADFTQNEYPQHITNYTEVYAYIGDNELPNSMAQLFTVDSERFPKGFNLTHVYMEGNYGLHPIFEIYSGSGILNSATLLERYDAGADAVSYGFDHPLPESLFFGPGESFYIAVHFEGYDGRNYPLGLGVGNGTVEASSAYMSNDKGKSWSLLADVLKGTNYENMAKTGTWCISALSKYPDWSEVLCISPISGQLKQGEKQTVNVTHNGTPVPNGNYRVKLLFDTNEKGKEKQEINATLNISGQAPAVTYNKVVEFGNLLVGQSKTITVQVFNKGYGIFGGGETYASLFSSNIKSTSEHFQGPEYLQNGFPARAVTYVELTYAPKTAGQHAGQVVFTDKDGRELRINVTGAATDPAKIAVSPETVAVGDLNANRTPKTVQFTIENKGKYPLQYVMPKFSDETFDAIGKSATHRFGYAWQSNLYGSTDVKYSGAPALFDAVNISSQFGDYKYFSEPIEIGFKFPFYDKTYDKLYISSLGTLSFDTYTVGSIYSPIYEGSTYTDGLGIISAYGNEFQIGPRSRVEYARQDGKFIVNFKDVLVTVYASETRPASFHIALSPNGDIEIGFDDYVAEKVFQQGCNLWVGIVDPDQEDPLTVTSSRWTGDAFWYDDKSEESNRFRYVGTGSQFNFYAPKPNMIASISPAASIVAPGQKQVVTAVVSATDDMYAGPTYTDLVIQSNDIVSPTKLVRFTANIMGDLKPIFSLPSEKLDFGVVFRTALAQKSIAVHNDGRSVLRLQGVSFKNTKFRHDFKTAVDIQPGQSKDIVVTLPTDVEGIVSDVMTITTSAGTKTVTVRGRIVGVPDVSLGYSSVSETMSSGQKKNIPLTITNTGSESLVYSALAGSHLSYMPSYKPGSKTHYTYVSSLDEPEAAREWVDIETNGLGTQYNYTHFLNKDIVPVDLPFEFAFFDHKFTRMYIYDSGFISFTERKDDGGIWPEPPFDFPEGSIYTNVIAPYWGLHSMDVSATAGIYHYVDEEQAVVSFIEYGNSMNLGIDFQIVLRRDGTFTFNYKPAYDHAVLFAPFGVLGVIDANGGGFALPTRYLELGTSLTFSPVVETTLKPGESDVADITLLADELAGKYSSQITLSTNIPTKSTITIPVQLNITGAAQPVFPDNKVVENVSGHRDEIRGNDELATLLGAYWYVPFEVGNTGSASYTITGIDVDSPKADGKSIFTLYWYGSYTDAWSGAQTNGWTPYTNAKINVGRTPVRFAIPVAANDNSQSVWQKPGDYRVRLTFHISGVQGLTTKTVDITLRVTEQPTMKLGKDEIRVTAKTDEEVIVEKVSLSNATGKYPLRYSIKVDPTGEGVVVPDMTAYSLGDTPTTAATAPTPLDSALVASAAVTGPQPFDVGHPDFMYDAPDEEMGFEYNRALYWPGLQSALEAYNYGTTTTYGTYKAATAFVGPKGGFNISHIYFAMHPFNLDNKDVEIEIYNGDPQTSTDVIGHGTYYIGKVETELYANRRTIATLDKPVYISEGQTFYVVLTFPTGQEYPATLVKKQDQVVSNRYLGFWDNYGWFDVATLFSSNYGSLGYLMSCLETLEGDAWVKVLDPATGNPRSELEGEVPAGNFVDLRVRLSAASAPRELGNKAVLVIRSNDPKASVTNFPVYLDKNASPTINLMGDNLMVREGESVTVKATVLDNEGDDFTLTLHGDAFCTTFENVKPIAADAGAGKATVAADRKSVTVSKLPGGIQFELKLAPDFVTAGQHSLGIKAVDALGHTSTATLNFTVVHVNSAPKAVKFEDFALQTGTMSQVIDLDKLFVDIDDTYHTYTITQSNDAVAKVFRADNEVFFSGTKEGRTRVTVTCTDPSGAKAENRFLIVVVDDITAVGDAVATEANVVVDREAQTLTVTTAQTEGTVNVSVYALDGKKMVASTYEATATPHTINIAALPAGSYVVSVVTADGQTTKTIVK